MNDRLNAAQARKLWTENDIFALGRMAHAKRRQLHPGNTVTYIVERNINYTNVCVSACRFCAFFRPPGHPEGYVLGFDELGRKVRETIELGGCRILLQGGMNPDLGLEFYLDMLSFLKSDYPQISVHGFSPPEINYLAEKTGLSLTELILKLKQAGLDSIPGGGAEILSDKVRQRVSPRKGSAADWLKVMETAHSLSMKTTATMMFGQGENFEDRIEHLEGIRSLQDRTGGFVAFIPWTFQPGNTQMVMPETSSPEYLKFLALSRLYLDNVPNIQASWVTQGEGVGQMALFWGANDFGSTMIEENVVASAGVRFSLHERRIREIIENAGFTPRRRNTEYRILED